MTCVVPAPDRARITSTGGTGLCRGYASNTLPLPIRYGTRAITTKCATFKHFHFILMNIIDFKVYMPAKDFEESKRFYLELGFTMSEGWGGTADFKLGAGSFRLQNYYVKDWADNFMIVLGVDDAEAWYRRVQRMVDSSLYKNICAKPPEDVDGSRVTHVWDPSGVLLVMVQ